MAQLIVAAEKPLIFWLARDYMEVSIRNKLTGGSKKVFLLQIPLDREFDVLLYVSHENGSCTSMLAISNR